MSSPGREDRAVQAGEPVGHHEARRSRAGGRVQKSVSHRRHGHGSASNTIEQLQQHRQERLERLELLHGKVATATAAPNAAAGPRRRRLGAALRRRLGMLAGALQPLGRFQGALAEMVAVAVAGAAGGLLVHSSLEDRHDRINYL